MSATESVTRWINQIKAGDRAGVQHLLERYFQRLVGLAGKNLQIKPGLGGYKEDVALSAFWSLCRGAEAGKFSRLFDRDDLWRLLFTITTRKAIDYMRRITPEAATGELDITQVLSTDPTPELVAELTEEYDRLLATLPDDLRRIALLRVEGYTNDEIAEILGCVRRTVERKLERIRSLWTKRMP
jgi:RNA polymerase sigma factor (sigma-70 family)